MSYLRLNFSLSIPLKIVIVLCFRTSNCTRLVALLSRIRVWCYKVFPNLPMVNIFVEQLTFKAVCPAMKFFWILNVSVKTNFSQWIIKTTNFFHFLTKKKKIRHTYTITTITSSCSSSSFCFLIF